MIIMTKWFMHSTRFTYIKQFLTNIVNFCKLARYLHCFIWNTRMFVYTFRAGKLRSLLKCNICYWWTMITSNCWWYNIIAHNKVRIVSDAVQSWKIFKSHEHLENIYFSFIIFRIIIIISIYHPLILYTDNNYIFKNFKHFKYSNIFKIF